MILINNKNAAITPKNITCKWYIAHGWYCDREFQNFSIHTNVKCEGDTLDVILETCYVTYNLEKKHNIDFLDFLYFDGFNAINVITISDEAVLLIAHLLVFMVLIFSLLLCLSCVFVFPKRHVCVADDEYDCRLLISFS